MTTVTRPSPTDGWPGLSLRSEPRSIEAGPPPGVGPLSGPRWLLVWNRDPLGECCCWRGTQRDEHAAAPGSCQRPGKHPWMIREDGELHGFVHGAADALEYEELADRYGPPGGARQLGTTLANLIVVDLDTPRAVRDFARMSFTVPREVILGVSTSPRGFHVWLDCPGWNQKALNLWMTQWLASYGGWHGTDEAQAGRRGFLVDVRTGDNRYVVWPGEHHDRRWISRVEFGERIAAALVGMPPWRMVPSAGDTRAPWAVDTAEGWLPQWIAEHGGASGEVDLGGLEFNGSDDELAFTWAELERWITRLETMPAGGGRNNALNQLAFHSGARCVAAGHDLELVRNRLIAAGQAAGTHGVAATVASGLHAGTQALAKARRA